VFLYLRELPGGGLVTIEATSSENSSVSCRLAVERRSDSRRREGHPPPVIAEISAPTQSAAFRTLYEIAADNVAVARGLLIWQSRRAKHGAAPGGG
jgi:hypothetical protein